MIVHNDETREEMVEEIRALDPDIKWVVTVKKYKRNRSLSQNSLYWMWITGIGEKLGYFRDEMHMVLALKFLPPVTVEWGGRKIVSAKSTSSLNVKEFTDYLNQIEIFAATELGLNLPHPADTYYEALSKREERHADHE
jgi:hypothetical protein